MEAQETRRLNLWPLLTVLTVLIMCGVMWVYYNQQQEQIAALTEQIALLTDENNALSDDMVELKRDLVDANNTLNYWRDRYTEVRSANTEKGIILGFDDAVAQYNAVHGRTK